MATKLSAVTAKKLTTLGITAKSEEEAKVKLNDFLVKEGIEGMEDEDIETLIDLAESFAEVSETEEEEEEGEVEGETEEELEELSKEEEIAPKKKAAPAAKPTKKVVVEEEEEDEEEDEEEEAPKAKKSAPAAKPAKPEAKKPAAAAPAKTVKAAAVAPAKAKPVKLNPKDTEADREHFDFLKTNFPDSEYLYAWISNAGVTVKYKGKNSNRAVLSLENASVKPDGTFTAVLYLPTFNGKSEKLTEKGIDFEICWSGVPFIKALTTEELEDVFSELLADIEASVNKFDKKLGENRVKMEENLKKTNPASKPSKKEEKAAAPAAKPTKKVVVEEEEEDEEEEAPKAKKPVAGKKPVKK